MKRDDPCARRTRAGFAGRGMACARSTDRHVLAPLSTRDGVSRRAPWRIACVPGVLALLLAAPNLAAAGSWEVTRKTVIDPLNSELHRHLPTFVRQRDLDGIIGLYAVDTGGGLTWDGAQPAYPEREERMLRWAGPAGAERIKERWEHLLALLPTIEKAELRIGRVGWRDADERGYPAGVRLLVRGTCADGARCQLDQHMTLRVRAEGNRWVITNEDVTARELVSRIDPRFALVTEAAGIANVHASGPSPAFQLFGGADQSPVQASGGSAVADVDGDGCEDVLLAGSPEAALYHNNCDGTFTDVTAASGLPRPYPAAATGVVFFDYDDDGDPDLFVAAVVGGDRLFRNDGGGHFTEVTAAAAIPASRWTSMPAVADYDRDGFLDLYLVHMGDHEKTVPEPSYAARNGVRSVLLHNERNGTFRDVTAHAGVGFHGWGLAGAWGDYDGDGWPDLYVANEFGSNALYRNRHDGTFEEVAARAGVTDGGAGMSVAWGDYDGDGDLDLYVSNMHANSGWALFHPDFPLPIPTAFRVLGLLTSEVRRRGEAITDRLLRGSTLFRNDGGGRFTDVSDAAGVRDAQWGWSAEFLDYDNDGTLDIYATNGFISGPILDDV